MTKQEEIREGIKPFIKAACGNGDALDEQASHYIMEYLASQGVVLKVDRELPENLYKRKSRIDGFDLGYRPDLDMAGYFTQQNMLEAGYTAWDSLIEES